MQKTFKGPSRKELEERIAQYLAFDRYGDVEVAKTFARTTPYPEMAADLVRIFNQWTVEVVAPEAHLGDGEDDYYD